MGGNGSFYAEYLSDGKKAGVLTHYEYDGELDGHKIVVWKENIHHETAIMNSRSPNTTYLSAAVDSEGFVKIKKIYVYREHKLVESVDLEFDENVNLKPSSHSHFWKEEGGVFKRKKHEKSNIFPIDERHSSLIRKITKFNKENHIWRSRPNDR